MNVAAWLERGALSHPSLPAVAHGERFVADYGQLARRSAGIAGALRDRYRLARGDRVAIVSTNHPSYLEALFGAWWAGCVAVPVNAKLHPSEINWILGHSGASLAFASAEVTELDCRHVLALGAAEYEQLAGGETRPVEAARPDDVAWLFYTSGTTGRPKGAMLTHRNLVTMSLAFLAQVDPTQPGDGLLHAAPMSHGSGLYAIPHVGNLGLSIVPESGRFDADEVLQLLRHWKRVSMFAAPTMLRRLTAADADVPEEGLRTIIWGGAPMHVPDVVEAVERFGPHLAQIYGQAETPMTISVLAKADVADRGHPDWLARIASAGIPNPAVQVRIGDPGEPDVGPGEVLVRGDTVMQGYWEDAAATERALRGDWLHTGDIGCFDESGYLVLLDRATDMIISGGTNIYPREIEEALAAHPAVREVSVVGRPDPEWGEVVVAYVVGDVSAADLDRHCLQRIARFKRPRDYHFLDALPKSENGKILKTELRAREQDSHAAMTRQ